MRKANKLGKHLENYIKCGRRKTNNQIILLCNFSRIWMSVKRILQRFKISLNLPWDSIFSSPFLSLCKTYLPFITPKPFLILLEAKVPAVLNCVIILCYEQFSWGNRVKCQLLDRSWKEKSFNMQTHNICPLKF